MGIRIKSGSAAVILLGGLFGAFSHAQPSSRASAPSMEEYQVKAGFVSSFANFVEWPPSSFHAPDDPLTICVLGADPFGTSLDALTEGKVGAGRSLVVRRISDSRRVGGCHLLFVSASEHLRLRAILASLVGQSIFSIGDTSDFIAEGGLVNLQVDNGKVRIEINADAARDRRLRVSSRLLQLARSVKP